MHTLVGDATWPPNSTELVMTHSSLPATIEPLGLLTTGLAVELRQKVEGKLAVHEDPNVQVVIQETPKVEVLLWLVDSDRPFLQMTPAHCECQEVHQVKQQS